MANEDTNAIIVAYLVGQAVLTAVVGDRIYVPALPEGAALPALGFRTVGGSGDSYIPSIVSPTVQFDCWALDIEGGLSGPRGARAVYSALTDVLQGIQRQTVTVGLTDYMIHSAIEQSQGQDLVDQDIVGYYRVLTFFDFVIRAG